jgi:phage gp36-like protein
LPDSRPFYFERADLVGPVPAQFILQALDDNGDGVEDDGAFDTLRKNACDDVDALLSPMFDTPFATPFPVLVSQAARTFAAALLYRRRGVLDASNPFAKDATAMSAKLTAIVEKDQPVPKDFPVSVATVTAITEKSKTFSQAGILMR